MLKLMLMLFIIIQQVEKEGIFVRQKIFVPFLSTAKKIPRVKSYHGWCGRGWRCCHPSRKLDSTGVVCFSLSPCTTHTHSHMIPRALTGQLPICSGIYPLHIVCVGRQCAFKERAKFIFHHFNNDINIEGSSQWNSKGFFFGPLSPCSIRPSTCLPWVTNSMKLNRATICLPRGGSLLHSF